MAGFVNTAEYAQAREDGQTWVTQFRKLVASAASVTNAWVDYTYSGGSPSANFYSSTPLESADVETSRRSMDTVMDPRYTGSAAACTR